jgi:hypothetical protein
MWIIGRIANDDIPKRVLNVFAALLKYPATLSYPARIFRLDCTACVQCRSFEGFEGVSEALSIAS